ncbi:hypothetical protein GCM10020229_40730 [Kitasatospora albolonga]|uniref:M23 family metallopeptidase n=1 Tax=Kitasatospora albolonga TaxID=68173 RepID=UPI0031EE049C
MTDPLVSPVVSFPSSSPRPRPRVRSWGRARTRGWPGAGAGARAGARERHRDWDPGRLQGWDRHRGRGSGWGWGSDRARVRARDFRGGLTLLPGGDGSGPPGRPDRRLVLLAVLLAAVLLVGVEPPTAHGTARDAATGAAHVPQAVPRAVVAPAIRPAVGPGPGRAWPVGGRSGLLQRFDPPPVRWAAGHRGVDLAASLGDTVRAAAPGVVSFSGMVGGRPVVTVTHPGSGSPALRTTYLPVTGLPVGTAVSAGQPIGVLAVGAGHCASDCLHWGLLRGKRYLDPLALLGTGRARLLPLDVR